jgi:hypothetical protein
MAKGDRSAVESLYLELRQLAKKHGLKIDFQLSREKPEDPPAS